ncbi:MAG: hypothetical protein ACRDGD_06680 [Candidatus Limnocylindria bacterium]
MQDEPEHEHPREHAHPELLGHAPQTEPSEPTEQPDESGTDLLTIALLVFFVSLIVIVAALLALPAIF